MGSSLHTSLAAVQVRDVLAKGESRVRDTHVRILGSVRPSLERGNLVRGKSSGGTSWSSRDVLRLQTAAWKTARNITCLKKKKKEQKKFKNRRADQGLVFLSPAVKENCCQKYTMTARKQMTPFASDREELSCSLQARGICIQPRAGNTLWSRNRSPQSPQHPSHQARTKL